MKKLMIAAAIVCAAVVSQAATFNWQAEGIVDESGSDVQSYFAFGFIKSDSKKAITGWTIEDAVALVVAGGDNLWTYAMPADEEYRGGMGFDGEFAFGPVTEGAAVKDAVVDSFMVIVNATDMDNWEVSKYSIVEGGDYGSAELGTADGNFTFRYTSAEQGAWQSVPEPTSGLLLLLGVAGLALRRRRA